MHYRAGFNPGSAIYINTAATGDVASLAAVNTTLGSAAGALSGMFTSTWVDQRKTGGEAVIAGISATLICFSNFVSLHFHLASLHLGHDCGNERLPHRTCWHYSGLRDCRTMGGFCDWYLGWLDLSSGLRSNDSS